MLLIIPILITTVVSLVTFYTFKKSKKKLIISILFIYK